MKLLWQLIGNHDGALRQLVAQAQFLHPAVLQEIATAVGQVGFKQVPLVAKVTAETIVDGFCRIGVVERAFNPVKDWKRDSENTRITRLRRWLAAAVTVTMKKHGRHQVDIADVQGKRHVALSVYSRDRDTRKLTDEVLGSLLLSELQFVHWCVVSARLRHQQFGSGSGGSGVAECNFS